MATEEDHQSAQSVSHKNVPTPQHVRMCEPNQNQPPHAPVMECCRIFTSGFHSTGHQENASSEEHGKNGDEFLVGEQMGEEPYVKVRSRQISSGRGIPICCADHREGLDIHGKNSQQCESPQYIDAVYALFLNQELREMPVVQIKTQNSFENRRASHRSHLAGSSAMRS